MNPTRNINSRPGIALLAVLMVIMAITVLALGFLSRSDVELACGQNMALRTQMDGLAESGLQHAKGLILNPQEITGEYWTGEALQQLVAGSQDYYDLTVARDDTDPTDRCSYTVDCDAYRLSGGERIGRSSLTATVRLDPTIAYWVGRGTTVPSQITINGDVYCDGALRNNGFIDGDAFAADTISGSNITGHRTTGAQEPITWPGLVTGDFGPTYYLESTSYAADVIDVNEHPGGSFGTSAMNPAGIRYRNGDIEIPGGVNITGTLVVVGDLRISGTNNAITAVKNFPALLVDGDVVIEGGASISISGLVQIDHDMTIEGGAENVDIDIVGGLFVANGGIETITSNSVSVNIIAAPAIASLQTWPEAGTSRRWGPAGGAFLKNVERR